MAGGGSKQDGVSQGARMRGFGQGLRTGRPREAGRAPWHLADRRPGRRRGGKRRREVWRGDGRTGSTERPSALGTTHADSNIHAPVSTSISLMIVRDWVVVGEGGEARGRGYREGALVDGGREERRARARPFVSTRTTSLAAPSPSDPLPLRSLPAPAQDSPEPWSVPPSLLAYRLSSLRPKLT